MVIKADLDQYRIFFKEVRQNLHKPLLSVIGNHELYGERGLELYHEIFGPDDYSFQINHNYFIVVNDAAKEGLSPEQLRWLEAELQKSQAAKTRLVFLHVPLFDPRGGENPHCLRPEEAARLLALFKKYKVTHVFAAHIHGYYAGAWDGLPYTITGGAGAAVWDRSPACLLSLLEGDHPEPGSGSNPALWLTMERKMTMAPLEDPTPFWP